VPVDEVLTLATFYREDDHLARLMLDAAQRARLDQLWRELHYVSQSPLLRVTAMDALMEVMVGNGEADRSQYLALIPLREPVNQQAAAFKRELVANEPGQLEALIHFAGQAYRRPLTAEEAGELRALYRNLREQKIGHEEAFRRADHGYL